MSEEPKAGETWLVFWGGALAECVLVTVGGREVWRVVSGITQTGYLRTDEAEPYRRIPAASELAELKRELRSTRLSRTGLDCRYTMGDVSEVSGSHCPLDRPCQRCELERERDEARTVAERMAIIARDLQRYPCARHGVDTCPDQGCSEPTDLPWETDHE